MADEKGPLPYLDVINAGLGQVLVGLPLLFAAYRLLHAMLKAKDPGLTFEQYNEKLRTTSTEITDFSTDWLTLHGYVQQADGAWLKTT